MATRLIVLFLLVVSSSAWANDGVSISWQVLDKDGYPLPGVEAFLVAYGPDGSELGLSHRWRIGPKADSEGKGQGGFSSWTPPAGWGHLQVEHPAVGTLKSRRLEWSEVERRPGNKPPHIILRATGGLGVERWRAECILRAKAAIRRAGDLRTMTQANVTKLVRDVGTAAYGPLLAVLEDHKNPARERFVWALLTVGSPCRAPIEDRLVQQARPILAVARFREALKMKPRSSAQHLVALGEQVIPELSWAVSVETTPDWKQRLQSVLDEVRSTSRATNR
jgi:hypothetical protein